MARFIVGGIVALVLAGIAAVLEVWTVVPGPTLPTLVLAVAIPELAPWGIVICSAIVILVQWIARGWPRTIATMLGAFALGCAFVPLVFLQVTIGAADRAMQNALGPDYAVAAPQRARDRMTQAPYALMTSFIGNARDTTLRINRGLPVMTRDGAHLALDLYRPPKHGSYPAIVLIYSGAWQTGRPYNMAERAQAFAAIGYTVVAVDYRHAPAFRYPTQIHDVQDALATIARHATDWEIDPTRVAIAGYSSGAELALLAAYDPEPLGIKAVVAYYAPEDLNGGYALPPVPDPTNVQAILANYIGGTPAQKPAEFAQASPIAHVRSGLPPTLLIGGARDELVRLAFQHAMRDRLHLQHDVVVSIDLPWSNHSFDEIPNGLGGQIARYYTERFFAATL